MSLASLPAPTTPAAALYFGKVMHAHLRPVCHRFSYRVMSLLIELDRLEEADRQSRLFAVNRAALFSFHEADHGERNGASLSKHVRRLATEQGVELAGGRIVLLCYPRLLGYVFNPLSVYFCYRASGELALLVYEVRNTFGEIHSYVRPVEGSGREGAVRQSQAKQFYVSPFMMMDTHYHFRLTVPGTQVRVRILQTDEKGPVFAAAFSGRRQALTTRSLLGAFIAVPLLTFKVVAAIHWEALRLWIKGAPLVPRPRARSEAADR
ncbi:MAG TPA: DUF1365 domain-containing protein [Bryobacteraceae bacterium]|nr:DUF1365 domain-containing protein [Bryobacteraceae bacterium]